MSALKTVEESLQLILENVGRVPIGVEVTPVRIADSLVGCSRGVLVDHVHLSSTAHLLHLLDVTWRHHEDQIRIRHYLGGEPAGAMTGEIEAALHSYKQCLV